MRPVGALLPLLAAVSLGCGSPTEPGHKPGTIVGPIQVESMEIVRNASSSSGLGVRVRGVIGDGCTELLLPITQEREGALIRIRILRQRPADAICTQIAKLFDQVVPLLGEFPPGRYIAQVNDRELAFEVP
jgi:hypothetical protein